MHRSFAHAVAQRYGFGPAEVDELDRMLGLVGPRTLGEARTLGGLDFDTLMKHPEFQDAWAPVQAQLVAEGNKLDSLAVLDAQTKMADAFDQMTTSLGLSDPNQIADTAKAAGEFVMVGKTIAGQLGTVQGLINQATTGIDSVKSAAQFTGGMIGVLVSTATALGAVSAGVGAAIVAVVGVVIAAVQALVNDDGPPPGTEICKGFFCTNATFTIQGPSPRLPACCCVFSPSSVSGLAAIGPGAPGWRPFPLYARPEDRVWFQHPLGLPGVGANPWIGTWRGADFEMPPWWRPIDAAFPVYHQIECDEAWPMGGMNPIPQRLAEFNIYWLYAWRANAAYALNGLKPQPDAIVLLHALRTWNASHEKGSTFALVPQAGTPVPPEYNNGFAGGGGLINFGCPPKPWPFTSYAQMVAGDANNAASDFDRTPDKKALIVHTGDPIAFTAPPPTTTSSGAPAGIGTGAKVLLGGTLLAGGGWLALGRPDLNVRAIEAAAKRLLARGQRRR
jgi:hypothetical protein